MTTGVVANPPILQFTLNNGQLAVNGSILTQVGGVNTATYADSGLTTPLPNPIPLNSRGEISDAAGNSKQLFLTPNTVYTFTLYDGPNGTGNQIWQAPYVSGIGGEILAPILATVTDQAILASYVRSAAEIAASVTPTNYSYAPGDVRRYGADPAGVSDSTSAIQTAINVVLQGAGNKAGRVYFADGTYKVSSTINIKGSFGVYGIWLAGDRALINFSQNGACFVFDANNAAPQLRLEAYFTGININGPASLGIGFTSSACIAITSSVNVVANVFVRDCLFQFAYFGIQTSNGLSCYFDRVCVQFCGVGASLIGGSFSGANNFQFSRCSIFYNAYAVLANSFANSVIVFSQCDIEGNNQNGTIGDGTEICAFSQAGEVTFIGCHLEGNIGSEGIFYHGNDQTKTINLIGCEIIHTCTNVVHIANGYLVANGGRIFNNTATNNTYLNVSAPAWVNSTTYPAGFVVSSGGTLYVCILSNINQAPPNATYWTALTTAGQFAMLNGTQTPATTGSAAANALWAMEAGFAQGAFGQGTPPAVFSSLAPPSGNFLQAQADTVTNTYKNASGTRINYIQSLNGADMSWVAQQAFGHEFFANNSARLFIGRSGAATIEPGSANAILCGTASLNWSGGNTQVAFTVNSDERVKQQIQPIDAKVLKAWGKVGYAQYKLNTSVEQKGPNRARWHIGVVAQRVKEAFESEGLDPFAYGLLCFDKWDKHEKDVIGEDGEPTGEKRVIHEAGEIYGIRYEEALALECAYLRSRMT